MTGSEADAAAAHDVDADESQHARLLPVSVPAPPATADDAVAWDGGDPSAVAAGTLPEPSPEIRAKRVWHRSDTTGRWVVGDPGRQEQVDPKASTAFAIGRPDMVVDGARLGRVRYRAASLRGLSHQENGKPRQDAFRVQPSRHGQWIVGCVADGVSSAKRSHDAADIVCEALGRVLADAMPAELPSPDAWPETAAGLPWQQATDVANRHLLEAATSVIRRAYEQKERTRARAERLATESVSHSEARDVMSTTAIAFVVSGTPTSKGFPVALTVLAGDSAAAVLSGGRWRPATGVKNAGAEVASSAVRPLPMEVEVAPVYGFLEPGAALAVYSDGIGDPLGAGGGVVGDFLADVWREPPDLLDFAQQVGFFRKSFTDDRTAVVVWTDSA